MIRFPASARARLPNASWLNAISSFSFVAWVRFVTITGGNQYLFRHAGSTNQLSFRVRSTTSDWFLSTTVGSTLVTRAGGTPTAGVLYHVAGTWQKNHASGLALYVDGALIGTSSTTSQTVDYDSGESNPTLFFACKHDTSDVGNIEIEGPAFYPNTLLTLAQIQAHRQAGWPHLVGLPRPGFFALFDGRLLTKIPDLSGNGRHIVSSDIIGSVSDQGMRGRWDREDRGALYLRSHQGAAGPPSPGPFVLYTVNGIPVDFAHPATLITLDGLDPGQLYEVFLTALDEHENESAPSEIVSGMARETVIVHTQKKVFLG